MSLQSISQQGKAAAPNIFTLMREVRRKPPTQEESLAAYRAAGLEPTVPKGNSRWGTYMVCVEHDAVPYCMDHHGELRNVEHVVLHRKLAIERHHEMVKKVYEYCSARCDTPVWAMCGGGSQVQVFFGTVTGYLGILYLTLEDLAEQERLTANGYLEACGCESYVLVLQTGAGKAVFSGMQVPGVEVRGFGE